MSGDSRRTLERLVARLRLELWRDAAKWRRERARLPGNRVGQELFWRLQESVADAGWFALSRKPALPIQKPVDVWRDLALAAPRLIPMLAALPFSVGEAMKWLRVDRDRAFLRPRQFAIDYHRAISGAPRAAFQWHGRLDLWRHGAWHPRGGVGAIAQTLLDAFGKHGGQTRFSTRVTRAKRQGETWCLETGNDSIRARHVIANLRFGI